MAQRTEVLFVWDLALGKYLQASPQASFCTGSLLPKSEVCIFSECPCRLPASVRLQTADSQREAGGQHSRRGLQSPSPSLQKERKSWKGHSGLAQCSP